jgi:hypothetical protein
MFPEADGDGGRASGRPLSSREATYNWYSWVRGLLSLHPAAIDQILRRGGAYSLHHTNLKFLRALSGHLIIN